MGFSQKGNSLLIEYGSAVVMITPWWNSEEEIKEHSQSSLEASITNGKITAKVSFEGWISFYNDKDELLTEEYWRNRNRIDRNSQASVPFYISSRGYGFLWNNPAIGNVVFGNNKTEWWSCVKG